MSGTKPDIVWQRAPLQALDWYVQCPTCGSAEIHVDVAEDDAGAHCPEAHDRFLLCEACGGGIEVVPVAVTEAYPAPPRPSKTQEAKTETP